MNTPGYQLLDPLAYCGKEGCENVTCTHLYDPESGRFGDRCLGWHCSYCDQPCSSQGHRCDAADAILGEAERLARHISASLTEAEGEDG